jgi:O-antigen/teichoic acid export membrane protein
MIQKISNYIREMVKSEFYRNIAGLFSGIFAARLIPALFALIIARLYAPEDFGIFVLFLSIASLLSIFTTGGYERALLLIDNLHEKQHIFRFSLKNNLIINGIILLGIILYIFLFDKSDIETRIMLLLIPVFAFFFGGLQLIRNILISNKLFGKLSALEITRALATGILQTLFFVLPETGLFLGIVLAQVATFIFFFFKLPETQEFRMGAYQKRELALARRYVNFPKYSVPSELFNYLSSQLPVFMIKPFFGSAMLGLYSFSHRYLSIPVQLTSISIGSVYVQKAQSLKKFPQELALLTFELFRKQFLLAIIPFTVLALWGNAIFSLVFGAEWEFSGTLGQLIAPWLFAVFIGSPLATILVVMEKQKVSMIFNIVMLFFRALALAIGGLILKDVTLTIALYSLVGFVFFSLLTVYSLRLSQVNLAKAFWFSFRTFLIVVVPLTILKLWL